MQILNKDIFEGLKEVDDKSIDLLFIDPPYNLGKVYANGIYDFWENNNEYIEWVKSWLDIAIRKLKSDGSLYIMNTTQNMPYIDIYLRDKMTIKSRIVWSYDSSGVQATTYFGSTYEPILYAVVNPNRYTFNKKDILVETVTGHKRKLIDYRRKEPKQYNNYKVPGNVWYFPRVRYQMGEYVKHPSQKPEMLLERIVKSSSNVGDTILDLFAGTFSLGVVCKRLERRYIGIELSHDYCEAAKSRLNLL